MNQDECVYLRLQREAREAAKHGRAASTAERLTLYSLESFLGRLVETEFRDSFVLKGGVLLSAYGVRRPTRDLDSASTDVTVDESHLRDVLAAVAAVDANDGLVIDVASATFETIRGDADYPGVRMKFGVGIHQWRDRLGWDVSTGEPIWPEPTLVRVPKLLGGFIEVLGYEPEMVLAEKGVTILERGSTSTRWRDFVDIVSLSRRQSFEAGRLRGACTRVADHRGARLGPLVEVTGGYPEVAQVKWRAWRAKGVAENLSHALFADQLAEVAAFLDPVFTGEAADGDLWNPKSGVWEKPRR